MGLQAKDNLSKLIKKKYGEFSPENMKRYFLEDFFVSSFAKTIDEEDYLAILNQMEKLATAQGLGIEDVEYLGYGQRYSVFGIGDAVIKLGNTTEKIFENPFRISPVYKQELKPDLGLYVSQRARTRNIPGRATQEMYNLVRDAGGLWLDIKDENLGYVENVMDFSSIYPEPPENDSYGVDFPEYNGNLFVIDYEDMIFLSPELKERMLNGEAPNVNSLPWNLLLENHSNEEMLFEGFIKNSNKLLEYEMRYQRACGNIGVASKCFSVMMKNESKIRQYRYLEEQRYRYDRNFSDIGNRFSIKEIGIQLLQKTNIKSIDKIVTAIKNGKLKLQRRSNQSDRHQEETDVEYEKGSGLDDIIAEKIRNIEDPYTTVDAGSTAPRLSKVDLEDPYRTL